MDDSDDGNGSEGSELKQNLESIAEETIDAARNTIRGVSAWIKSRSTLSQLVITGVFGAGANRGVGYLQQNTDLIVGSVLDLYPVFTARQLLLAVGGLIFGQTLIQKRELKHVRTQLERMEERAGTLTDGGDQLRDERGRFTSDSSDGTTGGGKIGGAIVGGALGSSYGPGGTLFGIVAGAILGEELEKKAEEE